MFEDRENIEKLVGKILVQKDVCHTEPTSELFQISYHLENYYLDHETCGIDMEVNGYDIARLSPLNSD